MKLFVVLVLSVCFTAYVNADFAVTQELVDEINSHPDVKWVAGHNIFSTKSKESVRNMLRPLPPTPNPERVEAMRTAKESISDSYTDVFPKQFSSLDKFKGCIHHIRDQGQCGSCWAHSLSEVISDNLCIASNGSVNVVLSPMDPTLCDRGDAGCNGGDFPPSGYYSQLYGLVTNDCMPYNASEAWYMECPSSCTGGTGLWKKYKTWNGKFTHHIMYSMMELMNHGPIQTGFFVYSDFMSYKSGVYHHVTGPLEGGHAVKVVGWGVEDGTPYWLIANSWGPGWGLSGFFKILRGVNECNVEDEMFVLYPRVEGKDYLFALDTRHVKQGEDFQANFYATPGLMNYDEFEMSIGSNVIQTNLKALEPVVGSFHVELSQNTLGCASGYVKCGNETLVRFEETTQFMTVFPFGFHDKNRDGMVDIYYKDTCGNMNIQMALVGILSEGQYPIMNVTKSDEFQVSKYLGRGWTHVFQNPTHLSQFQNPGLYGMTVKVDNRSYYLPAALFVEESDIPGKPGTPHAVDVTSSSITLNWAPPV